VNDLGLYRVVGTRDYRGHPQGTEFPARLDPRAARRAIQRGSIAYLGPTVLEPQRFTFPHGWTDHQREEA
jgi:hypothetical protein